ncbi:MAG: sulfur carrier protein ThiS [Corynebacterium sp.]|uniref:sulfur carrier protein ThiS n=1 Tax=Corynebacterium sp. TaxID=1720 RepID=UPI0026DA9BC5|nr:sulfur carrier protein ThiS [Corynebacterium sp.]MDO4762291.1 sulfur carrier protein ThiS [Corynebacterium sp.]
MKTIVYNESSCVTSAATVAQLVAEQVGSVNGVAVARNSMVVPRSLWEETPVDDGDCFDVLSAVQGG